MASDYEYRYWRIHDFRLPAIAPEPHEPAPLFELTISAIFSFFQQSINQFRVLDVEPYLSLETLRFDLHLLRDRNQLTEIVGPMLTRVLEIRPEPSLLDFLLKEVIRHGNSVLDCTPSGERIVFPLHAVIRVNAIRHVDYVDESDSLERAVEESESEFERENYGMVPAKESSVKEMVKRVEGGESSVKDQDCMICLEGFEVGSMASEMPCFHTFHEKCIEKWLKKSNYCPLCRFELPAEER